MGKEFLIVVGAGVCRCCSLGRRIFLDMYIFIFYSVVERRFCSCVFVSMIDTGAVHSREEGFFGKLYGVWYFGGGIERRDTLLWLID